LHEAGEHAKVLVAVMPLAEGTHPVDATLECSLRLWRKKGKKIKDLFFNPLYGLP
jgi:hypothetical protein